MSTSNHRDDYSAADYLTYLHQQDTLGFITEQIGFLTESPEDANLDLPEIATVLDHLRAEIAAEYRRFRTGERVYSNGVQINRVELYPDSEPGNDGEDVPVVGELHYTIHPNGTPEQPGNPGGTWADEVAARLFGDAA